MSTKSASAVISAIAVVALSLTLAAPGLASSPVGKVGVESGTAPLGETIELAVSFTAQAEFDGVGSWSFRVRYDAGIATVFQCLATVAEAEFQNCAPGQDPEGNDIVSFTGTVPGGAQGNIAFGSITFQCDGDGTFPLPVTIAGLGNAQLTGTLEVATIDGQLACGSGMLPTDTPTPTDVGIITLTSTPPVATATVAATATLAPLDTPTSTPTPERQLGDSSCDGTVNAIDAALVLQNSAGLLTSLPCEENADVSGDGQINALDAALILQFAAGFFDTLPPG